MAYVIVNGDSEKDGSGKQHFFEFDPGDRETVETIEYLLAKRNECPSHAREKMDHLIGEAVRKQPDTPDEYGQTGKRKRRFLFF